MLHFENILHSVPTISEIYLFGILSAFISCLFWLGPPCHAIFFAFLLYLSTKYLLANGKKEEDNNTTQHATQNKIQLQQQPLTN